MKMSLRLFSRSCFLVLMLNLALGEPAVGTTYTVNETADLSVGANCNPGSTTCTLRAAIVKANVATGADIIVLPSGQYTLSIPGSAEDDAATGDLDIRSDLLLFGNGADSTIIDANGLDRIFDIHDYGGLELTIYGVTITGGSSPANEGGGGIRQLGGEFTLQHSRVTGNRGPKGGGLEITGGTTTVDTSFIHDNRLYQGTWNPWGGGIWTEYHDYLTVQESTIASNRCEAGTDSSCKADGIYVGSCDEVDSVKISNSTITDNEDEGIRSYNCDVEIKHSTIVGNHEHGVSFGGSSGADVLTMRSSISANNGVDCQLTSGIHDLAAGINLDADDTCGLDDMQGDLPNTDPKLLPLGYYADLTPSFHPDADSPVVDVANACVLSRDQDNFERPDGDTSATTLCDIGSIEVLPCSNPPGNIIVAGPISTSRAACNWLRAVSVTIADAADVTFSARSSVILDNGFETGTGSSFTAAIDRAAGFDP